MTDRYGARGAFTIRVTLDIETDGWDGQGPTEQAAREHARDRMLKAFGEPFSSIEAREADDLTVIDIAVTDESIDVLPFEDTEVAS